MRRRGKAAGERHLGHVHGGMLEQAPRAIQPEIGMTAPRPFRDFKVSPEIFRLVATLYVLFPLSLRNVEHLLHERGIDRMRVFSSWHWHVDEIFVKVNGKAHCLRRAVDHVGAWLKAIVTKRRDRKAALNFLR